MKKLKKLIIATGDYNDEKILEISGKNISLEDLEISWLVEKSTFSVFNLQDKFPNLTNLSFSENIDKMDNTSIEVKENKNCKIQKIKCISNVVSNIFYIQSYENLVDIELDVEKYCHSENGLPFFSEE